MDLKYQVKEYTVYPQKYKPVTIDEMEPPLKAFFNHLCIL